jgi:putative hemolysin
LLGADPARRNEEITHEELRDLLLSHSAVPEDERTVLAEVFDAGQRSLLEVMRPRTEVDFLPADTPIPAAREQALAGAHSRYPVVGTSLDDVVGFVHLRDLLLADPANASTVADVCRPILSLPASKPALATLSLMRRTNDQIVLVVDEYSGTAGIATLEDIVEEIVGEIGDEFEPTRQDAPPSAPAQAGTQQVDGLLIVEDFERATGIGLPKGPYETVAGCVVHRLQRLPRLGDSITLDGHRLTVSELDGHRIARVRLTSDG